MALGTFDIYLVWYMAADLEPKPASSETRLAPALGTSAAENPTRATHDPCGASLLGQFASGPVQGPVVRTKKKKKKKMSKGK